MKLRFAAARWQKCIFIALLCGVFCLTACGNQGPSAGSVKSTDGTPLSAAAETAVPVEARAAAIRMPEASGRVTLEQDGVTIDASNTENGYVMVKSTAAGARRKVILSNGTLSSTYDLPDDGAFVCYPLQHGSGDYTLTVYENVESNLYIPLLASPFTVALADEFEPFLYPNQYVSYAPDTRAVLRSFELVGAGTRKASAVRTLYRFVADTIEYDYDKAATVGTGYLPDVDETLATEKGICFDYSALLATMLRVQEVPTQLVIGYIGPENLYHAWNKAYYDGEWVWMDATFDGERAESAYADERRY